MRLKQGIGGSVAFAGPWISPGNKKLFDIAGGGPTSQFPLGGRMEVRFGEIEGCPARAVVKIRRAASLP